MNPPRHRLLQLAASAAALPMVAPDTQAQAYPSRPVTMIVPASAGGPTDVPPTRFSTIFWPTSRRLP
jgi:tripartite-type tricarboxylate transporter receptor subunit TctC